MSLSIEEFMISLQIPRIRSLPLLQDSATSVLPMTTTLVSVLLRSNLEWMSILRLMLQTPIADHHSRRDKALDREDGSQLLAVQRKKCALDALVSLVTQLAANQKPASVARVCNIRSSNDHHTSVCPSSQQFGVDEHPEFSARNDAIVIRGVYDVATDTSAEARKLDGKFEALVSLVTQLAVNQNLPLNLEWMSILRLMPQTPLVDHHSSRDKALDREDGSQLLAIQCKK
ncbi:hypothetical protein Fmac_015311 [Flemingia macrophylla]|uniref:Uncharacterized protein n=1 Tax=Flemingia macrophylla TaxID=520843 RepID=A0ABD1MF39_9FABA